MNSSLTLYSQEKFLQIDYAELQINVLKTELKKIASHIDTLSILTSEEVNYFQQKIESWYEQLRKIVMDVVNDSEEASFVCHAIKTPLLATVLTLRSAILRESDSTKYSLKVQETITRVINIDLESMLDELRYVCAPYAKFQVHDFVVDMFNRYNKPPFCQIEIDTNSLSDEFINEFQMLLSVSKLQLLLDEITLLNPIKFKASQILIKVSILSLENGKVIRFEVKDNGLGIDLPRLELLNKGVLINQSPSMESEGIALEKLRKSGVNIYFYSEGISKGATVTAEVPIQFL